MPKTFTEYFKLNVSQDELEFLDIFADRDIPLFLDPYGISAMNTDWSRQCEAEIATYFQFLVDSLRNGDRKSVQLLLGALHEVDEVALGYSSGEPRGRGVGVEQAKEIQDAFETSAAGQSGEIRDIADCALMIPGINRDKISDITANILKRQLITFTQEQCRMHDIPMRRVAVNNVFDASDLRFKSYHTELPVIKGRAKILLPVFSVRHVPELSKDKYYRNFVLEYLKAEHLHAGDSLSTVLRNGNVVVRIADLKKKYPIGADFLHDFSTSHPEILANYKEELRRTARRKENVAPLKTNRRVLSPSDRIRILRDIEPGNAGAHDYHKIVFESLIFLFEGTLSNPLREREIDEGRKRVDIVFDNTDRNGFFFDLNSLHKVKCPKIFIECKNYGREIGNPEIDQLLGRFSPRRGSFGILLCRSIENKELLLRRCKDAMQNHDRYILVFEDSDFEELLRLKDSGDIPSIHRRLSKNLDDLIM